METGEVSKFQPSLPTRERGLKQDVYRGKPGETLVAPYTGAWIETLIDLFSPAVAAVAPYTGAWIETLSRKSSTLYGASRSLHGSVD